MEDGMRLDRWLWAVRVYKTRSLATTACRGSAVRLNEGVAKPSQRVRPGDRVEARIGELTRTLRVVGLTEQRVGAARLPEFLVEETPAEAFAQAREKRARAREAGVPGAGRPTKKHRRDLERFFGWKK
jgi:ribosome-associated heat shock protein Hsp15